MQKATPDIVFGKVTSVVSVFGVDETVAAISEFGNGAAWPIRLRLLLSRLFFHVRSLRSRLPCSPRSRRGCTFATVILIAAIGAASFSVVRSFGGNAAGIQEGHELGRPVSSHEVDAMLIRPSVEIDRNA